jgi:endonuclease/exonuclease/phosphatase (EEP) superfamily protein YafD
MRQALTFLLLFVSLALAASFGGRFHGLGDTLAVGRPVLAVVVALLSLTVFLVRRRFLGAVGLALALGAGLSLVPPAPASVAPERARDYSIYQKNLLWSLPDTLPMREDIRHASPDFVTLQELHRRNRPILEALRGDFPHQHFCPFATVGGTAVLSRWPPTGAPPVCGGNSGMAAMQVATPDGPLWIVSLHLHWPYPFRQPEQLASLLPVLEGLGGPVLVGGDFNMVPWSHTVRAVAQATRSASAGYAGGTFAFSYERDGRNLAAGLPELPIDHVLVPETGLPVSVMRRERLGSDHRGLLAVFAMAQIGGAARP